MPGKPNSTPEDLRASFTMQVMLQHSHGFWRVVISWFLEKVLLDVLEIRLWHRKASTVQFSGHMCPCNGRCHKNPWINECLMAHTAPDEWVPGSLPGRMSLYIQKYIHSCFLHSFHCQLRSRPWSCKWRQPGKSRHRKQTPVLESW